MTCSTIPNARITTRCLPAHETPVLKSPGLAVAAMGGLPCGGTQFGIHHRRYRSLTASIPFQNTLGGFDITCR
jgi:hypothetical protein